MRVVACERGSSGSLHVEEAVGAKKIPPDLLKEAGFLRSCDSDTVAILSHRQLQGQAVRLVNRISFRIRIIFALGRLLYDFSECCRIVHGQVSQYLSVELDIGLAEGSHQLGV